MAGAAGRVDSSIAGSLESGLEGLALVLGQQGSPSQWGKEGAGHRFSAGPRRGQASRPGFPEVNLGSSGVPNAQI